MLQPDHIDDIWKPLKIPNNFAACLQTWQVRLTIIISTAVTYFQQPSPKKSINVTSKITHRVLAVNQPAFLFKTGANFNKLT